MSDQNSCECINKYKKFILIHIIITLLINASVFTSNVKLIFDVNSEITDNEMIAEQINSTIVNFVKFIDKKLVGQVGVEEKIFNLIFSKYYHHIKNNTLSHKLLKETHILDA
jgi:hypothetical protein